MLPITGPTYVVSYQDPMNIVYRNRYKQVKPYKVPSPYELRAHFVPKISTWAYAQTWNSTGGVSKFKAYSYDGTYSDYGATQIAFQRSAVMNRALSRFYQKQGDQAQLLTGLLEARQSMSMITKRVKQLGLFASSVARGNIPRALRVLRSASGYPDKEMERRRRAKIAELRLLPPSHWKSKSVGNVFLETWFGWLPTIGDIQASFKVLGRTDFATQSMKVSAREMFTTRSDDVANRLYSSHKGFSFAKIGCSIRITNTDAHLVSQLGLTNPLLTAYQLIPYSWMANWFINMEQFLQQFSIYPGVVVEHLWYVEGIKDTCDSLWDLGSGADHGISESFHVIRSTGSLPGVTLQWRAPSRLSFTRGATLASLLVTKHL